MLAYKENVKLDSNTLIIDLPDDFVGKELEVSVVENSLNYLSNDKISNYKLMMKPYENELLTNGSTFSREDIYD